MAKTVLIPGGRFYRFSLCSALLHRGYRVRALDLQLSVLALRAT
jgi:hypothetical protein